MVDRLVSDGNRRKLFPYDFDSLFTQFGPAVYRQACTIITLWRNEYISILLRVLTRSGKGYVERNDIQDNIVYNHLNIDFLHEVDNLIYVLKHDPFSIEDTPESNAIRYNYYSYLGYTQREYELKKERLLNSFVY